MYASKLNDLKHHIFQMPQRSETLNILENGIFHWSFCSCKYIQGLLSLNRACLPTMQQPISFSTLNDRTTCYKKRVGFNYYYYFKVERKEKKKDEDQEPCYKIYAEFVFQ